MHHHSQSADKAIMTKAKAMYEQRLTPGDFKELCRTQSVRELAQYLHTNTHYARALDGISLSAVHRGQLENDLRQELFLRFASLARYDHDLHHSFYTYMILKAEIQLILAALRHLGAKDNLAALSAPIPPGLTARLSAHGRELAEAKDFEGLLLALDKTPYKGLLTPLRPGAGNRADYSACEFVLQKHLYERIFELAERFGSAASRDLRRLFGVQAELENIAAIYRLKRFYRMSPEQIRAFVLPWWTELDKRTGETLIEAQTTEELYKTLLESHYKKYLEGSDPDALEGTGNVLRRIRSSFANHVIHFSFDTPTVFASYLLTVEIELENLQSVIEGVRYGLAPEMIERQLAI
jgi:V/A-type H+-transporting ATPase subunit C